VACYEAPGGVAQGHWRDNLVAGHWVQEVVMGKRHSGPSAEYHYEHYDPWQGQR